MLATRLALLLMPTLRLVEIKVRRGEARARREERKGARGQVLPKASQRHRAELRAQLRKLRWHPQLRRRRRRYGCLGTGERVTPLPPLDKPVKSSSSSARLRQRFKKRVEVWRLANSLITLVNALDSGSLTIAHQQEHFREASSSRVSAAQSAVIGRLLGEAQQFARDRRLLDLGTGDQSATLRLVKSAKLMEGYARVDRTHSQVPLIAEAIVEPANNDVVQMLDALPEGEARYYSITV